MIVIAEEKKPLRPAHIGFIPDGNRRWGELHNIPRKEAYETGIRKISDILTWCREEGIKNATFWGFSTENFGRDPNEISSLFELFEKDLITILMRKNDALRQGVRVRFFGRIHLFPKKVYELLRKVEEMTAGNSEYNLNILFAYGGRAEIVDAANAALKEGKKELTEEILSAHMYTHGLPDPDMIIRTSGERRTSGFLPWQTVYSELYFSEKLWPDFSREDFMDALSFYEKTQRRFGK